MRDKLRDKAYYDKFISFTETEVIEKDLQELDYLEDEGKACCASGLVQDAHSVIAMRYSRGDTIESMCNGVQKAYEILKLRHRIFSSVKIDKRSHQMWENLDLGSLYHYLTLLAFMVSLRFPAKDILNVLKLIKHEGEDALLELVAARFGEKDAGAVETSKYPKVYGELVNLTRAEATEQPVLIKKYVEGWYRLNRPVYWHDTHKGAEGAYKGYWCFEVALAVMLLGIDDSQVQDHPHYPADLVKHYRQQVQST